MPTGARVTNRNHPLTRDALPALRNPPDSFLWKCKKGALFDLYSPLVIYRTRGGGTDEVAEGVTASIRVITQPHL